MGGAYCNLINMQKWAGLSVLISLICIDGRGLFHLINMHRWDGLRERISLLCIYARGSMHLIYSTGHFVLHDFLSTFMIILFMLVDRLVTQCV